MYPSSLRLSRYATATIYLFIFVIWVVNVACFILMEEYLFCIFLKQLTFHAHNGDFVCFRHIIKLVQVYTVQNYFGHGCTHGLHVYGDEEGPICSQTAFTVFPYIIHYSNVIFRLSSFLALIPLSCFLMSPRQSDQLTHRSCWHYQRYDTFDFFTTLLIWTDMLFRRDDMNFQVLVIIRYKPVATIGRFEIENTVWLSIFLTLFFTDLHTISHHTPDQYSFLCKHQPCLHLNTLHTVLYVLTPTEINQLSSVQFNHRFTL